MHFGDYAPYLEVSVAINLLLAVWATLWRYVGNTVIRLRDKWFRAMRSVADNVGEAANIDPPAAPLMEREDRLDAMGRGMPAIAKVAAGIVVATIALALLLVDPESCVSASAMVLIAFSALAQPTLMLLLVTITFVSYALSIWVPYRLFRRRAIKTIEGLSRPSAGGPAKAERPRLQLDDDGRVVRDNAGWPIAAIHRVTDNTFIILVLADVFDRDLDITHTTPENALDALRNSYSPG